MQMKTDLRFEPIPPTAISADDDSYKNVAIDVNSSEHGEPLIALAAIGIKSLSFYRQSDGLNAPLYQPFQSAMKGVYVRSSVGRKLKAVNKLLSVYRAQLVVLDGFRPIKVQEELWQWMLTQAKQLLPGATVGELEAFALRYASNPNDFDVNLPHTWPTHSTGGAVDVTLEESGSGQRLFMGGIYLDSSDVSSTRYYETFGGHSASHAEARRNRRLLYWAMQSVGFVNYPFEWWHYDYLTQASLMNQGVPIGLKAHYGLANNGESPE